MAPEFVKQLLALFMTSCVLYLIHRCCLPDVYVNFPFLKTCLVLSIVVCFWRHLFVY